MGLLKALEIYFKNPRILGFWKLWKCTLKIHVYWAFLKALGIYLKIHVYEAILKALEICFGNPRQGGFWRLRKFNLKIHVNGAWKNSENLL